MIKKFKHFNEALYNYGSYGVVDADIVEKREIKLGKNDGDYHVGDEYEILINKNKNVYFYYEITRIEDDGTMYGIRIK